MEEVPVLTCSLHPKKEKVVEEDIARALTPTKSIPMGSVGAQNSESLVLPGNEQNIDNCASKSTILLQNDLYVCYSSNFFYVIFFLRKF